MKALATAFSAICIALPPAATSAQWRCDCTTIVDTCEAAVTLRENWIEVTTDQSVCARVDYFIDGLPFVSVVVDGQRREDWIPPADNARVLVQSCQVCRDYALGADNGTTRSGAGQPRDTGEGLTALVQTEPEYPASAQQQGVEGSVTLEFVVTPFGTVESARVTSSQPAGVFDLAALSAVNRWRYPANPGREPVTLTETVEFRLSDFLFDISAAASRERQTAQSIRGTMNQCVRENTAYNYGEMIEVGLMNACTEPLTIVACARGTGALADRWVCTDSESQATVLVPRGDSRLGGTTLIATDGRTRTHRYADSFFVARAPNSEYWWLACDIDNARCRSEAHQWLRSVDRQPATINPQPRSALTVGRSH